MRTPVLGLVVGPLLVSSMLVAPLAAQNISAGSEPDARGLCAFEYVDAAQSDSDGRRDGPTRDLDARSARALAARRLRTTR